MDKERLITGTEQTLRPLETRNVISWLNELNMKSFSDHPGVSFLLVLLLLFALWRRPRITLLTLFTLVSLTLLIRYAFPPAVAALSISSTLPFVIGCMGIVAVLLYFIFIRSD